VLAYRRLAEPALSFGLDWVGRGNVIGITYLTALDVLAEATDGEDRRKRREFLENVIVFTTPASTVLAVEKLLWATFLPTRLTGDDAIVAITARNLKLPLYSLDPDRYSGVPGLTILPAR
jgi:hypothetical protein